MAEAMTSETIIEAYWLLQGYWTKMRFPFKTQKGAWSDIDVLAYHPEKKNLVIAESKVQGDKWAVFAFTKETQKSSDNILKHDGEEYLSFLNRIPRICANGTVFDDFRGMVKKVTVQLVSNYFITEDVKPLQIEVVSKKIRPDVPGTVKLSVRLDSTLEIICEIVGLESEYDQGRRYGHPVLDIARELNRYLYPSVRDAGNVESRRAVKDEIVGLFRDAFCAESDEKP